MRTHRDRRRLRLGRRARTSTGSAPRVSASGGATTPSDSCDVVKFHWEVVDKDGEAFGVGLNFLFLAADGRIERDFMMLNPLSETHATRAAVATGRLGPARRAVDGLTQSSRAPSG
jgi:hypothetical protein